MTVGNANHNKILSFGRASSLIEKQKRNNVQMEQNKLKEVSKKDLNDDFGDLADENTILIQRTLRSGQSIYYPGNIVVLGDINPGAEIVAGGNIIVMGHLRGVAHAGAFGSENAVVAAFKLQPTQLRIANHITRAPDGDEVAPRHPEIARIHCGVVVIEEYNPIFAKGMNLQP